MPLPATFSATRKIIVRFVHLYKELRPDLITCLAYIEAAVRGSISPHGKDYLLGPVRMTRSYSHSNYKLCRTSNSLLNFIALGTWDLPSPLQHQPDRDSRTRRENNIEICWQIINPPRCHREPLSSVRMSVCACHMLLHISLHLTMTVSDQLNDILGVRSSSPGRSVRWCVQ